MSLSGRMASRAAEPNTASAWTLYFLHKAAKVDRLTCVWPI